MPLELRPFCHGDEATALAAWRSLEGTGFNFLLSYEEGRPWSEHVAMMDDHRIGRNLPAGFVPASFLAATVDGEIVGRVSIRFALNDFLATRGGHIGYGVLERFRGRGYGTAILRQALTIAADHEISSALLTCDDDNVASRGVIERCGGVLESVITDDDGVVFRRYWVSTRAES